MKSSPQFHQKVHEQEETKYSIIHRSISDLEGTIQRHDSVCYSLHIGVFERRF